MTRPKDRWILTGLTAAFLVLVFVELMLIGSAKERAKTAAWVTHTRDVLDKINELTSYLREAEAGRRGYVLSGQDEFLGQFTNRVGRVHQALRELRQLTKNNPRQSAYGDRLEALIFPRLLIFTNSVRERQEKGLDMPAQVKFMEQGQQAMDPIRQVVSQITTEERVLLKAGQATQQKSTKGTTGFAVLVTIFGLGLFITMFILFGRANRRRYQAEEVLQKTNLELEERVRERTAELSRSAKKATWLASFPEDSPNPVVEVDLDNKTIVYANPFALRLFPDLHRQGLTHPLLLGVEEVAKTVLAAGEGAVRREVVTGESCFLQTISCVSDVRRLRIYNSDITERKEAEQRLKDQLSRLGLLQRITHAIGERQDLKSIFQVVVRSLEDHLPIDFGCICLCDATAESLTVNHVGVRSQALAQELALAEETCIDIDGNGLSRCLSGKLVYEPDISQMLSSFPQRLARGGLGSLVIAPLRVESNVFGVLVAARRQPRSFSSSDCEFLQQLSEHVALAAHQAQLYGALREAYDELQQTQQAVMQQERLRALGQMASGIAHDINNAISPVALYTETLLEKESNLSPRARDYLETIARAIEDVAATVSRMREFYRPRDTQPALAPVDLNQLVQEVMNLTRARWSDMPQQRGIVIHIETDLNPNLPFVPGVGSEIREALTNLVLNAVDAMPEGGTLTLRTNRAKRPGPSDAVPLPRVVIEVTDTGVGMDEDTRRRCLEPFFTTKGERGTGLGLAMVYGVVQRHGAEIEIESTPGQGTTIRLCFPVPAVSASPAVEKPVLRLVPSRLRILIVDDDPMVLKCLGDTLKMDGHQVVIADHGQAGIEAFAEAQTGTQPFGVVITDLGMPYLDGRKVAVAIKGVSPTTPVILLTGWGQRLVAEGDVPPQVDEVLTKPPRLNDLRLALARFCPTPTT